MAERTEATERAEAAERTERAEPIGTREAAPPAIGRTHCVTWNMLSRELARKADADTGPGDIAAWMYAYRSHTAVYMFQEVCNENRQALHATLENTHTLWFQGGQSARTGHMGVAVALPKFWHARESHVFYTADGVSEAMVRELHDAYPPPRGWREQAWDLAARWVPGIKAYPDLIRDDIASSSKPVLAICAQSETTGEQVIFASAHIPCVITEPNEAHGRFIRQVHLTSVLRRLEVLAIDCGIRTVVLGVDTNLDVNGRGAPLEENWSVISQAHTTTANGMRMNGAPANFVGALDAVYMYRARDSPHEPLLDRDVIRDATLRLGGRLAQGFYDEPRRTLDAFEGRWLPKREQMPSDHVPVVGIIQRSGA